MSYIAIYDDRMPCVRRMGSTKRCKKKGNPPEAMMKHLNHFYFQALSAARNHQQALASRAVDHLREWASPLRRGGNTLKLPSHRCCKYKEISNMNLTCKGNSSCVGVYPIGQESFQVQCLMMAGDLAKLPIQRFEMVGPFL